MLLIVNVVAGRVAYLSRPAIFFIVLIFKIVKL